MNLALCSYIHYLEICVATNNSEKVVFWVDLATVFHKFQTFPVQRDFFRLGILIKVITDSIIILIELQMARILLIFTLLHQIS